MMYVVCIVDANCEKFQFHLPYFFLVAVADVYTLNFVNWEKMELKRKNTEFYVVVNFICAFIVTKKLKN